MKMGWKIVATSGLVLKKYISLLPLLLLDGKERIFSGQFLDHMFLKGT